MVYLKFIMSMFWIMEDKNYKEAYDKLKGYTQKQLFGTMTGEMEYEGIELHCTAIVIDETVERLKQFFKGYNFKITGDTNSETITIK
jgi:hypothetical protein